MVPQGITIEDAVKEYQDNKIVITGNDGELKLQGVECIDCHKVHPASEMRYCECDESWVCLKCCSHCTYNEGGPCLWSVD